MNNKFEKYIRDVQDFPKPGIVFKDISPLLRSPEMMREVTVELAKEIGDADVVVGADARGFLFGPQLAMETNKPFVMVRKPGKLPGEVVSFEYELEYGTDKLEILKDSIQAGQKVVVVDDLLATGGTVGAIVKLIESLGATVIKALFVIELSFLEGSKKINAPVKSLIQY